MTKNHIFVSKRDLIIIVGTLVVSPANILPIYAKQNNAILIEINPKKTEISSEIDLTIRSMAIVALPKFVSIFKGN
ncbi:MAG: hypothetical protein OEY17_08170 [Nitrosopumilus sp.]|nr:hypothetical protein [Nitrosopumilus sp.]